MTEILARRLQAQLRGGHAGHRARPLDAPEEALEFGVIDAIAEFCQRKRPEPVQGE